MAPAVVYMYVANMYTVKASRKARVAMSANIQKPSTIKDIGRQIHETNAVRHAVPGRMR